MEEIDSPAVRPRRDPLRADCEAPVVKGLHGCAQSGLNRAVRWCTLHNCASDIPLAMLDVLVGRERPSFCWVMFWGRQVLCWFYALVAHSMCAHGSIYPGTQ